MRVEQMTQIYHPEIPSFLKELSRTPLLQRLTQVDMNCGMNYTSFPLFQNLAPYSRAQHSLGAALIVWHFQPEKAPAAACLFHDCATPVFSHVVDFMRHDTMKQEATEADKGRLIAADAHVQKILAKLHLSNEEVADYHQYPLADNPSPRLSADRLEYTLGNLLNYGFLPFQELVDLYDDLIVLVNEEGEKELGFRHARAAYTFAGASLRCSRVYSSDADRYGMMRLAQLLQKAVDRCILTEEDLENGTEPQVIRRLEESSLQGEWQAYQNLAAVETKQEDPGDPAWIRVDVKRRYIDPLVAGKGRTSSLFEDLGEQMHAYVTTSYDYWVKGYEADGK
jgi:HD superfamily phosphohydrolase